nr:MAG TPA_asm: hypothetical protein [Caudoviricetes sp.]
MALWVLRKVTVNDFIQPSKPSVIKFNQNIIKLIHSVIKFFGDDIASPRHHAAINDGLYRIVGKVQRLLLQSATAEVNHHGEPVVCLVQVTRATQPLDKCALLSQCKLPRQAPCRRNVSCQPLKNWCPNGWGILPERGLKRKVFAGSLRQRQPVRVFDDSHYSVALRFAE